MAARKDELLQVIATIALSPSRHIADEFSRIAHEGLRERRCSCGRRMDPELDGYSRTCAECLGDDDRREQDAREPDEDPQTGFLQECGL